MWPEELAEKPWRDPIIEEIRKFREEHAARFNYDVDAIAADLRKRQSQSGHKVVSFASGRREVAQDSAS